MTSTLKLLFVISLATKISSVKDCDFDLNFEFSENGYKVTSFSLPWDLDTNAITAELAINPADFEDKTKPGSIRLYYSKDDTIDRILDGKSVKYKIRYPKWVESILSIDYNGETFCEYDLEPSKDASSTIIMEYNITLRKNPFKLLTSGETIYLKKNSKSGRVLSTTGVRFNSLNVDKKHQWLETYKFHEQCGKRDHIAVQTILGGREVYENEFPWLVALFRNKREYFCAGTLITDKHVISAAHCTLPYSVVYMEFGKHFLDKIDEADVLIAASKQIINHPDHLANTGHADISIIVTKNPIKFNHKILPICLWHFTDDTIGQTGTVAGWGQDQSGYETNEPMAAQIDIVSNEECLKTNEIFRKISSGTTFCAGANRKGSCHGDSGSGFVVLKDKRWYLKGVVSTSITLNGFSCDASQLSVFCGIEQYLEWIKMNIL